MPAFCLLPRGYCVVYLPYTRLRSGYGSTHVAFWLHTFARLPRTHVCFAGCRFILPRLRLRSGLHCGYAVRFTRLFLPTRSVPTRIACTTLHLLRVARLVYCPRRLRAFCNTRAYLPLVIYHRLRTHGSPYHIAILRLPPLRVPLRFGSAVRSATVGCLRLHTLRLRLRLRLHYAHGYPTCVTPCHVTRSARCHYRLDYAVHAGLHTRLPRWLLHQLCTVGYLQFGFCTLDFVTTAVAHTAGYGLFCRSCSRFCGCCTPTVLERTVAGSPHTTAHLCGSRLRFAVPGLPARLHTRLRSWITRCHRVDLLPRIWFVLHTHYRLRLVTLTPTVTLHCRYVRCSSTLLVAVPGLHAFGCRSARLRFTHTHTVPVLPVYYTWFRLRLLRATRLPAVWFAHGWFRTGSTYTRFVRTAGCRICRVWFGYTVTPPLHTTTARIAVRRGSRAHVPFCGCLPHLPVRSPHAFTTRTPHTHVYHTLLPTLYAVYHTVTLHLLRMYTAYCAVAVTYVYAPHTFTVTVYTARSAFSHHLLPLPVCSFRFILPTTVYTVLTVYWLCSSHARFVYATAVCAG